MALFSKTKKNEGDEVAVDAVATTAVSIPSSMQGGLNFTQVIIAPRITEKSAIAAEKNVYTFTVNARANKHMVAQAIRAIYKVTPVSVAIVNVPTKYAKNQRTGRVQIKKRGFKKAMVQLKSGDSIAIV